MTSKTSATERPARVSFELGALAKPLAEQFAAQGVFVGKKSADRWQEIVNAIVTLRFADVLTWGQAQKAYDRLGKEIMTALERGSCAQ